MGLPDPREPPMNPQEIFCPNMDCPARDQPGKGNIHIHSRKDKRYVCEVCQQTFATTKGTIFYRLHSDPTIVMDVVVLLAYGCPVQAIVKGFRLDERTVSDWHERAGKHCGHHWVQRTPAIAAQLTDHLWTPAELFAFKVPLLRWTPPAQRGRPSLATIQLAQRWAS